MPVRTAFPHNAQLLVYVVPGCVEGFLDFALILVPSGGRGWRTGNRV